MIPIKNFCSFEPKKFSLGVEFWEGEKKKESRFFLDSFLFNCEFSLKNVARFCYSPGSGWAKQLVPGSTIAPSLKPRHQEPKHPSSEPGKESVIESVQVPLESKRSHLLILFQCFPIPRKMYSSAVGFNLLPHRSRCSIMPVVWCGKLLWTKHRSPLIYLHIL